MRLRRHLLGRMLGRWPARGARLLEINSGKGYFSSFLEDLGFLVATAGTQKSSRGGEHSGCPGAALAPDATDLPFESDGFDWAVLHLGPERNGVLEKSLEECSRISSMGFAVTFWNRLSLAFLLKGHLQEPDLENTAPIPFWIPWRFLGKYPGEKRLGSILMMPPCCWHEKSPLVPLNSLGQGLPFGAWCVISVEFGDSYPLTGLPLRLEAGQT